MAYKDLSSRLTEKEKNKLNTLLSNAFCNGFKYGYEAADNEGWIDAEKFPPAFGASVLVTIKMPDGVRRTATSRYIKGEWTGAPARNGEVIRWRPKMLPYNDDL